MRQNYEGVWLTCTLWEKVVEELVTVAVSANDGVKNVLFACEAVIVLVHF